MIPVKNMEMPQRKQNRLENYDYSQNDAYFITIGTKNRKQILSRISVGTGLPDCPPETVPLTTELLWHGKIADLYIRQMDAFYSHLSIDKFIIMPDHIHLLVTVHGQPGTAVPTRAKQCNSVIPQFVGTLKRFCNKEYGENIWQSRYYDHVIRNQQDYDEIWQYIENNPTKWAMKKQGSE